MTALNDFYSKIKIFFSVMSVCLLLTSCFYDKMYNFDDDELAWMSPYEEGDTILFCSDSGNRDSLIIDYKRINNSKSPFMQNEGFDVFNAGGIYKSNLIHNHIPLGFEFQISKKGLKSLFIYIFFSDRLTELFVVPNGYVFLDDGIQRFLYKYEMSVNGVKYDDLFHIESESYSTTTFDDYPYELDDFWWSKSKGLIKYKYSDTDSIKGDVYTFYKRLPYQEPKSKGFWNLLFGE